MPVPATAPCPEPTWSSRTTHRLAVVGYGYCGSEHARELSSVPGVAVTVVDADPRQLAKADQYPAARLAEDPDQILDEVDAVIVATPPGSHAAVARRAIRAGTRVLVGKPRDEMPSETATWAHHDIHGQDADVPYLRLDFERSRICDVGVDGEVADGPMPAHARPVFCRTGDIISPYIAFTERLLEQDHHVAECIRIGAPPKDGYALAAGRSFGAAFADDVVARESNLHRVDRPV